MFYPPLQFDVICSCFCSCFCLHGSSHTHLIQIARAWSSNCAPGFGTDGRRARRAREAAAEALADLKCRPSETIERVEGLAATLRDARPLKKGQLLDSLATDPPLGVRAAVESDSEVRRACGVGRA